MGLCYEEKNSKFFGKIKMKIEDGQHVMMDAYH